jgi:hypothetical protein
VPIKIKKIQNLSAADVATLRDHGAINTVDDLRMNVGADLDRGIQQVSEKARIGEDTIIALLMAERLGTLKTKHLLLSSFRNHHKQAWNSIRNLLIVIAIAGFMYALYRFSPSLPLPQQVVVKNAEGIPAYRVILQDDLALQRVLYRSSKTVYTLDQVVGRYALTKLNTSDPILCNQLLAAPLSREISGRYVVSVPVKASALAPAPKAGDRLSLLALATATQTQPQTVSAVDAVLLGIEQKDGGTVLVVAVQDLQKVNAISGGSTIVGLGPPTRVESK